MKCIQESKPLHIKSDAHSQGDREVPEKTTREVAQFRALSLYLGIGSATWTVSQWRWEAGELQDHPGLWGQLDCQGLHGARVAGFGSFV